VNPILGEKMKNFIAFIAAAISMFATLTINCNAEEAGEGVHISDWAISGVSLLHIGSLFAKSDMPVQMSVSEIGDRLTHEHIGTLESMVSGMFVEVTNSAGTITASCTFTDTSSGYQNEKTMSVNVISYPNGDVEVHDGDDAVMSAMTEAADSRYDCIVAAYRNAESSYIVIMQVEDALCYRYKAALANIRMKLLEQVLLGKK